MSTYRTSWVLLVLLILFSWYVCLVNPWSSCGNCDPLSHHLPDFDGKKVSDFPLATYQGLEFVWDCTRRCWDSHKCRSYMFNMVTGLCSTFAVGYSDVTNTFNPVSDEAGSELFTACGRSNEFGGKCISDTDCLYTNALCSNIRCVCDEGYSFDTSSGECVTRCVEYGDFGIIIPDTAVLGHNLVVIQNISIDDCAASCVAETTFLCISLDYRYSDNLCNLQDIAWHDPGLQRNNASGWTFRQRHCKL